MYSTDTTQRVDGSKTPRTLNERISGEEWVGAGLQPKSRDDYARKISILVSQIQRADNSDLAVTPARMAEHLAGRIERGEVAQSTARSLKAAVLFWIAEGAQAVIAKGSSGYNEYDQAYTKVRNLDTKALPKRTSQTSSPKLKSLPREVLDTLERYGETAPGVVYVGPLLAFLRANLLVGLRPEEWFGASMFSYLGTQDGTAQRCLGLRVRNSKNSYGRANGPYREILLHSISATDLATILHLLEVVEKHRLKSRGETQEELAKSFFKPLRHCMANALTRSGHPPAGARPTLYSSRHQAVADAKASGLSDKEIAAFFGHSSPSTAKSHYGKKLSGSSKMTFRPSPETLSAVRKEVVASKPSAQTLQAASDWLKAPNGP